MIAANSSVARFLERHRFCSVRRIVKIPDRWPRIAALAAETGTRLPDTPDHRALEQWLCAQKAQDPSRFADLSLSVVKLHALSTDDIQALIRSRAQVDRDRLLDPDTPLSGE